MRYNFVLLGLLLTSSTLLAADSRFTLRLQGARATPAQTIRQSDSISFGPFGIYPRTAEVSGSKALGVGLEYRAGPLVGLDFEFQRGSADLQVIVGRPLPASLVFAPFRQSVQTTCATVGVSFHPLQASALDLRVGPLVGVLWSEGASDPREAFLTEFTLRSDTDLVYGAGVAVDVRVGSRGWLFSSGVTYLAGARADVEDSLPYAAQTLSPPPLQWKIGFGYRF